MCNVCGLEMVPGTVVCLHCGSVPTGIEPQREAGLKALEAFIDELGFNQPPRAFCCETCGAPMMDRGADKGWCSPKCLELWKKKPQ